jgi:hypothetical protein
MWELIKSWFADDVEEPEPVAMWRCKEFPTRQALLDWMNDDNTNWWTFTDPFIVYAEGRFLFFYQNEE